jgi:hypothetical protein
MQQQQQLQHRPKRNSPKKNMNDIYSHSLMMKDERNNDNDDQDEEENENTFNGLMIVG